jgi:uncharacterized integral membrane protein (TIGR00697 family)
MFNIFLLIGFLIVNYIIIFVSYKYFKVNGLFASLSLLFVLATVQTTIFIDIFNIPIPIGSLVFATTYLITGFASKFHDTEVKKLIYTGTMVQISLLVLMGMVFLFNVNNPEQMDNLMGSFGSTWRIIIASISASYLARVFQDKILSNINNKYVFLLANAGSQFVDTLVFMTIAFLGVMGFGTLTISSFIIFILKYLVTLLGVPFYQKMILVKLEG